MAYEKELECPFCQHVGRNFKVEKEWIRGTSLVNRLVCPKCSGLFRIYWGERKDGSEYSYILPAK